MQGHWHGSLCGDQVEKQPFVSLADRISSGIQLWLTNSMLFSDINSLLILLQLDEENKCCVLKGVQPT